MELEKIRPEVRDALDVVADDARCVCSEAYTSRNMKDPACNHDTMPYIETIRAELLRLATIEADALIALDCEHDWQVEHKRAEKAEAELAALKDRMFHGVVLKMDDLARGCAGLPSEWLGRRVRVVLEE